MVINGVEKKIKQGRGMGMLGVQVAILNNVVRVDKKMIFESRLEGGEGLKHMNVWGKSILSRGKSKLKGPESGECWEFSRNIKVASMAGAEGMRGLVGQGQINYVGS